MLEAREFPTGVFTLDAEGVERIVSSSGGFVDWLVPVRFDTVLEAFGLPCGIFNLDASVADVGADSLSLCR